MALLIRRAEPYNDFPYLEKSERMRCSCSVFQFGSFLLPGHCAPGIEIVF